MSTTHARPAEQDALALLQRHHHNVHRIWRVEPDRILYEDHNHNAKTALIEVIAAVPRIHQTLNGWPA